MSSTTAKPDLWLSSKVTPVAVRAPRPTPAPRDHHRAQSRHGARSRLRWNRCVASTAARSKRRIASLTKRRCDQGRQPGCLAAARRRRLHGSDDAEQQRHRGARAPSLRQGGQAVPRDIASTGLGIAAETIRAGGGLRLPSASSPPPSTPARAPASTSPRVSTAFPHGLSPLPDAPAGDRGLGRRRRRTEIDVVIPARHWCSTPSGKALYDEIVADARRLRRGAPEGDPRHRRPRHAAQRRAGLDGGDDGGRRFHQDLDRQGEASTPRCRSASRWCARSAPISSETGYRDRLQAGRRHLHRQGVARLARR